MICVIRHYKMSLSTQNKQVQNVNTSAALTQDRAPWHAMRQTMQKKTTCEFVSFPVLHSLAWLLSLLTPSFNYYPTEAVLQNAAFEEKCKIGEHVKTPALL